MTNSFSKKKRWNSKKEKIKREIEMVTRDYSSLNERREVMS